MEQSGVFVRIPETRTAAPPSEMDIRQWEVDHGARLPADYARFMRIHDGGFIYPEYFPSSYPPEHEIYDEMDQLMQVDALFGWQEFVKQSSFSKTNWNPAEFAPIAYAAGGHLLLRIADPDHGSVHFWWRNNPAWDSGESPQTGRVADSFVSLLRDKLVPHIGPSSRWDGPTDFARASRIEF